LMEHRTEMTERDISWLDRLIAEEREGASARPKAGKGARR